MWTTEHSAETSAPTEAVWELYEDVTTWPEWNAAVDKIELDGPFAAGTTGQLSPAGQGPLPFRVVTAEQYESYTSETEIADTVTLRLTNALTTLPGGGTRITHRAELVGPAAEYFGQAFGAQLGAGVPKSVAALAALAAERSGGAA